MSTTTEAGTAASNAETFGRDLQDAAFDLITRHLHPSYQTLYSARVWRPEVSNARRFWHTRGFEIVFVVALVTGGVALTVLLTHPKQFILAYSLLFLAVVMGGISMAELTREAMPRALSLPLTGESRVLAEAVAHAVDLSQATKSPTAVALRKPLAAAQAQLLSELARQEAANEAQRSTAAAAFAMPAFLTGSSQPTEGSVPGSSMLATRLAVLAVASGWLVESGAVLDPDSVSLIAAPAQHLEALIRHAQPVD